LSAITGTETAQEIELKLGIRGFTEESGDLGDGIRGCGDGGNDGGEGERERKGKRCATGRTKRIHGERG
jgi:hypothetical protein